MSDIPTPNQTGGSGTQVQGPQEVTNVETLPPIHGLPIAQAIEGLAASYPKGLGGQVPAALIVGMVTQVSRDLDNTQRALRLKDESFERVQNELTDAKVEIATLKACLNAVSRTQLIKQGCIFVGTALLGVSIDLYKNQLQTISYLLAAFGVVLLACGFFAGKVGGGE